MKNYSVKKVNNEASDEQGKVNETIQLTAPSGNFSTSTLIGVGELSQNGKHIMINNSTNNIIININSDVTASYQKTGTGTVTFTATGFTLAAPRTAVINTQYGSASVSYSGSTKIVLVNNV